MASHDDFTPEVPNQLDTIFFRDVSDAGTGLTDGIGVATFAQAMETVLNAAGLSIKHSQTETGPPTINDDETAGWEAGSIWVDATGEEVYLCASAATGAAEWRQVASGGGGGGISISTGGAPPTVAPSAEGDIYIDTTNDQSYMAVGTASSSDWKQTSNLPQGLTSVSDDTSPTLGGNLDGGGFDITNIGNVDGVDISALVSLTIANLRSVIGGLTDTQGATADRFVYWDADGTLQQCSHEDIVTQAHSDLGIVPQNRISTSTDPGANDDGAGTNGVNHLVNDLWTNTTTDNSWICQDITTGAAVWTQIDGGGGGGADVNLLSVEKNTAGTINKGQVVYVAGYDTDKPTVELADADDATALPPIGVANASITDSTAGDVVMSGIVDGMDTSAFTAGDNVYLDTTAGALVATRPDEEFVYRIGQVIYSHASNGVLRVNIERVKGRYWLYGNWDGKVNTASSLDNYVTCPATGTIESCEVTFAKFLSGSDGANYWSFDVQNASQSDRSALAAAYDATTDPTWKAWQDLGALNATAANKEVAEGDIINLEIVETGTPPTLGGNSILLRIKILPAN